MVKTESTADASECIYLLQWSRLNYQNKLWLTTIGLCLRSQIRLKHWDWCPA